MVELRSPLVDEPTGPLPDGFPAYFVASVSRPSVDLAVLDDLLRTTAVTFDAACGYLTADTTGMLGVYGVSDPVREQVRRAHLSVPSAHRDHPRRALGQRVRLRPRGRGRWCRRAAPTPLRVEPIDGSDLWWLQLAAGRGPRRRRQRRLGHAGRHAAPAQRQPWPDQANECLGSDDSTAVTLGIRWVTRRSPARRSAGICGGAVFGAIWLKDPVQDPQDTPSPTASSRTAPGWRTRPPVSSRAVAAPCTAR